jgi:hypothetical protein
MGGATLLSSGFSPSTFGAKCARLLVALLGIFAIVWGIMVFPTSWRQSTLQRIAAAILNREVFAQNALVPFIPALDEIERAGYCQPKALQSAAIIRLRLAESAIATGDRTVLDDRLSALEHSIRRSLSCEPSDSFLWMILAWLDGVRQGPRNEQLAYLRQSYLLGPHEGWVAVRRNRLALSMFGRLPTDIAQAAVREFAEMVESWIYWDAIAIFTGPGWPVHQQLLASLGEVGVRQREAFYSALYDEGYNVIVPGVRPREPRPWY